MGAYAILTHAMNLSDYMDVAGMRVDFNGHTYALCRLDRQGITPEEYANRRSVDSCVWPVIDMSSRPSGDGAYPFVMMRFEREYRHSAMRPAELCGEPFGQYDIEDDHFVDRVPDRTFADTDGNKYESADAFLAHACEAVTKHLQLFKYGVDWNEWRAELCWWDVEMDERLRANVISEATHEKFVACLYDGLNELNTHIW